MKNTVHIKLGESQYHFDEKVASVDMWYDRHERLWCLQLLNKDGYQVGNAQYIGGGKKEALQLKKQLEKEHNI